MPRNIYICPRFNYQTVIKNDMRRHLHRAKIKCDDRIGVADYQTLD